MNDGACGGRTGLNRRTFLLSVAAGGLLCAAGTCLAEPEADASLWPAWLLDSDNAASIGRLGAAYRVAHPEEGGRAALLDAIDRALVAVAGGKPPADASGLRKLMLQRVRDEYARGEIVRVNGWILPVTEARLYALVSLDRKSSSAT